jgi:hypothetical protein
MNEYEYVTELLDGVIHYKKYVPEEEETDETPSAD